MNIQWQNSENVKINNINTSAIIEDSSEFLSYFADKYIITKYKIKTGDIVEYAGIKYIIVSQIDRNIENRKENQYNYKARIRQADFETKFIITDKLYLFYSIVEGEKFTTIDNGKLIIGADVVTATLPFTEKTNLIKRDEEFIKWGRVWRIQGIDKSKNGLVILSCQSELIGTEDDVENEIANRFKSGEDRLNGNIEPILPFDDDKTETPGDPEPEPEPVDPYTIEVLPVNTKVRIYGTIEFTVTKYKDGVVVPGNFEITIDTSTTAIASEYVFKKLANNKYSIKNNGDSYEFLSIRIKDLDGNVEDKIINHELVGMFG